ncbi:hypothetical protein MMF93_00065 [Streptomyces tubbatahanensis]|uniref:Uncharacterized protein n=1 Tax=Streptomyces tubbatahanensis TaxID=2923272 RepID=A0ABY3XKU3_9ACTN|nr:hypothetical protein [Streptomyces tubbatahanensis]UNS95035.1 hypothetical protein MMF93_00065 [Streptomyces tubbatahanensis]
MNSAVPDPEAPVGTYMLDGRLISQWVTLVEPMLHAQHLATLSSLCSEGVLSPLEADWWSRLSSRPGGVCAAARDRGVGSGDWPSYAASFTRFAEHLWVHESVLDAGPAYRAAARLLQGTNLGFLLELGPSAALDRSARPAKVTSPYLTVDADITPVDLLETLVRWVGTTWAEVIDGTQERAVAVDMFVWGGLCELAARVERLNIATDLAPDVLRRRDELAPDPELRGAVHGELVRRRPHSMAAELALCWWPEGNRYERTLDSGFDYVAHRDDALRVTEGK